MYLIELKPFHMKLLSYIVTIVVVLVSFGESTCHLSEIKHQHKIYNGAK